MICKIVIPTTGNAVMLERLLQPWAASSFCWDAIEIVVAQNGEGESCEKELAAYKKSLPIRHVHFTPPCKNHALNQVIEEDPRAFIIFYDDDVRVDVSAIQEYIRAAKMYGEGHYFGGPVEPEYSGRLDMMLCPFVPTCTKGLYLDRKDEEVLDHQFFLGHNWAAFAKDIIRCGCFDERLGPGKITCAPVGDECKMQEVMSAEGCKAVFLPSCRACHYVDTSQVTLEWSRFRAFNRGFTKALRTPWGYCSSIKKSILFFALISLKILCRIIRKQLKEPELYSLFHRISNIEGELAGLKAYDGFQNSPHRLQCDIKDTDLGK
jgi:hypothetical protein